MLLRDDSGQTHTLEAVLVAVMLLGGVAFVVTFDAPSNPNAPSTARLEKETASGLDLLNALTTDAPKYGNNTLVKLIAEALQGNPSNLTTKLNQYLPPGAHYSVYLTTGYGDRLTVYDGGVPPGQAISVIRPLDPKWSYVFLATDVNKYDATTKTAMEIFAIPVLNGNVVDPGGVPVGVKVTGTKSDGGTFTVTSYSTTVQAAGPGPAAVPHVSLFYRNLSSNAKTVYFDARDYAFPVITGIQYVSDPIPFRVAVSETEGVAVPAGTVLNINVPPNWNATAAPGSNAGWTILQTVENLDTGGTLRASLNETLVSGEINFNFTAIYGPYVGETVYTQYDSFMTYLTGSVHATSEFMVRLADSTNTQGEVEEVYLSAPSPMGSSTTGTWAVAIKSPATNLSITRVEIFQPDGLPIFGNLSQVTGPAGGSWTNGAGQNPHLSSPSSSLVWTGYHRLNLLGGSGGDESERSTEFILHIGGGQYVTPRIQRDPISIPVTYERGGPPSRFLRQEIAPGLYTHQSFPTNLLNTYPGYANPTEATTVSVLNLTTGTAYRLAYLTGDTNYTITSVPLSKDILAGGYLTVGDRIVPIGEDVDFSVDVSGALLRLSRANMATNVTLKIFAPWSGLSGEPVHEEGLSDSFLLSGGVTSLLLAEVTNDNVQDVIVGTSNGNVYAFNGTNGYKVAGLTFGVDTAASTPTGSVGGVTSLAPITLPGGSPGFIVGTNENSARIYVIDRNFDQAWNFTKLLPQAVTAATDSLGYNIASVNGDFDYNGDGVKDVAFAQDTGHIYVVNGVAPHTVLDAFPIESGTTGARIVSGNWGFAADEGLYFAADSDPDITTGWEDPVSVSQVAVKCTDSGGGSPTCTKTLATDQVKRAQVNTGGAAAYAIDKAGQIIWDYPGAFLSSAFTDLNDDGITDVIAGNHYGLVLGLNGSQPSPPAYGLQTLVGTRWVDQEFLDVNHGYFVNHDGMFQYTDDGGTTRVYVYDEIGDMVVVPGANGLGMVNRNLGYIVGDAGSLWRFSSNDVEADSAGIVALSGTNYVGEEEASRYEYPSALDTLRNYQDVAFTSATTGYIITDTPDVTACGANVTLLDPLGLLGGRFCYQPLLLYTTNGAESWTVVTPPPGVEADLHRLTFPTASTGYVVGKAGTLLKITNAGTSSMLITPLNPGTTVDLYDVHFLNATHGFVAGDDGTVLKTTDGGDNWSRLPIPSSDDLRSVAFLTPNKGVAAGLNATILRTWDGGQNWTRLTQYLDMNWYALDYPAEEAIYGAGGGSATTRGAFWLHSYRRDNMATIALGNAPSDLATLASVRLATGGRQTDATALVYQISFDNGLTWRTFNPIDPAKLDNRQGDTSYWSPMTNLGIPANQISAIKFRIYQNLTSVTKAYNTPVLKNFSLQFDYLTTGGSLGRSFRPITFGNTATDGPGLLEAGSTMDWNVTLGELRARSTPQFWAFNAANASVTALNASADFNGDGVNDVVVGTGAIYNVDTALPTVNYDNRVYVVNGVTGGLLWRSNPFPGEVLHITVPNLRETTGDSVPDIFVTYWDARDSDNEVGGVARINGATFQVTLGEQLTQRPTVMIAGAFVSGNVDDRTAVGTRQNSTVAGTSLGLSGDVFLFGGRPSAPRWRSSVDTVGAFATTWTIPKGYLFGTYVALAEVRWAERDANGAVNWASESVQTANFINYFIVTPPSGRIPKTPLYNLELVAWYDDWR